MHLEGAINGTKTLGDVASSVFAQIQRSLLDSLVLILFLGALPGKFLENTCKMEQ